MNRYVYMGLRNWFRILPWAMDVARRNKWNDHYSVTSNYQMIRKMTRSIIRKGHVKVEVTGEDLLPKASGYVILSNHQGFFDGMAIVEAMEQPFHFLAMKEMKDFKFVKYVMEMMGSIYIEREDIRQSLTAIKECADVVSKGENVLIFPEGTLEKEDNTLLPYKPGALKAAYLAKAPIVPIVLIDSFLPFDRRGCKPCTVRVEILKPYYYEDYKNLKTVELAEMISKQSEILLKDNKNINK